MKQLNENLYHQLMIDLKNEIIVVITNLGVVKIKMVVRIYYNH